MTETRARGRRRSRASEEAILSATLELLSEIRIRDLTIEAIAQKARVGKNTIYKWWPSKTYIALDAFRATLDKTIPIPDTGSVEQDLKQLVRSSISMPSTAVKEIFAQFLAEAQSDQTFASLFCEYFLEPRRKAIAARLDRAMKQGEIRDTFNAEIALDLIFGPLIFRMLVGAGPLPEAADTIIDTLMHGLAPRTLS
jgi:AcrR family transcriptional regulator